MDAVPETQMKTGHGTTTSPMVLMNARSGRVVDVLTRCGL